MLWLWLIAASPTALAGACPKDTAEQVLEHADAAHAAFADLDTVQFEVAEGRIEAALPCVKRTLTSDELVRLHNTYGMFAFFRGDMSAARRSFSASKALDGDLPDWVPPGGPLETTFDTAELDDDTLKLDRAPPGGWTVDGTATSLFPANRAFFLQGYDLDQDLLYAGYHRSIAEIPILDSEKKATRRKSIRTWGTFGSGVVALGAAGTFTGALVQHTRLQNQTVPISQVETVARSSNTLTATSTGLLAVAATAATVTWVVPW